ncbi:MAG: hypothetical protein M3T96_05225 [Acidobacteriota bacterium]|nr:hypothetical protein [Acidobacteriota bacterium]
MNEVGELIREAIEDLEGGATERAFAKTCEALTETLKKSLETKDLNDIEYQKFIKQHWRLLIFTGLPRALPLTSVIEFNLTKLVHGFNLRSAEDLILHLVRRTALTGKLPPPFRFHAGASFEIAGTQILVPATLGGGLLGIVIFQPVNKNESVPDKYWLNISDFKMFISELWGRIDLAERVVNFYLD